MFALITPRANRTRSKNVEYFNLSYVPVRRSICALLIGTTPFTSGLCEYPHAVR